MENVLSCHGSYSHCVNVLSMEAARIPSRNMDHGRTLHQPKDLLFVPLLNLVIFTAGQRIPRSTVVLRRSPSQIQMEIFCFQILTATPRTASLEVKPPETLSRWLNTLLLFN